MLIQHNDNANDPINLKGMDMKVEQLSVYEWLRQGNDLHFIEGIGLSLLVLGAVVGGISLFNIRMPYGRYTSDTSRLFHIIGLTSCKIPAKLAWFLQELPSFVLPLFCVLNIGGKQVGEFNPSIVLLGMFIIHYFNRVFLYALTIKGTPTPISSIAAAILYTTFNGYMQGRYFTHYLSYETSWFIDPRFLVGHVMFLVGMAINVHSDYVLRNLRRPGETGYKIPYGGAFEFVSGANYFGETLEWSGYALASWSWPGFVMAAFTAMFLGSRALQHHWWYQKKFDDYPKNRKAFIPFLL